MKFIERHIQAVVLVFCGIFMSATAAVLWDKPDGSENGKFPSEKFICPMHPEIVSARPGSCPECGMALKVVSTTAEASTESGHHDGCCSRKAEPSEAEGCPHASKARSANTRL